MIISIMVFAALLRISSLFYPYSHPDEIITVAVSDNVLGTPTLDTNWKNAALPEHFKYAQYNFSGYILVASAVRGLLAWIPPLSNHEHGQTILLRGFSSALGTLCVLITYMLGRQWYGKTVGLSAAVLVALSPLLYQDSLYARPETLFTFLFLASLWLLGLAELPIRWPAFAGCALLGFLVSIKISALLLLPLIPLVILRPLLCGASTVGQKASLRASFRSLIVCSPVIFAALCLGFLAGAPAALANIGDFVHGVAALGNQYTSGHWPHGEPDANFLDRLSYGFRYFAATQGILFFFFCGAGFVALAVRKDLFGLLAFILVFAIFLRFLSYPVFFERNLSHLIPLAALFCSLGVVHTVGLISSHRRVRQTALAVVVTIVALQPLKVCGVLRIEELTGRQQERVANMRLAMSKSYGVPVTRLGWVSSLDAVGGHVSESEIPMLLEFWDPGDSYSPQLLNRLNVEKGFGEVGVVESVFPGVPASTLQTYFTPTTRFLYRSARPVTP
jgi:hypothetical protein